MLETKETDDLINSAIESFLREEPIDDILVKINSGGEKFNNWVYDKKNFLNEEYSWLINEEDIFDTYGDVFENYHREELDLKIDKDILEFMNNAIDRLCEGATAYHYALYKGVYISASCECHGQGGLFFSDFCIYKSKDEFRNFCKGSIISSPTEYPTTDTELIAIFKKNVTDKYFKD